MPTTITITRATQLFQDNDNDGVADAGDILRTYLHIVNVGAQDATNLSVDDNFTGSTLVAGSVKITPIAFDDTFTGVTGNTPITYSGVQGVLANDVDPDGAGGNAGLSVTQVNGVSIGGVISITGGTVDMHADGSFTFTPTTGFNGTATFNYGVVDAQGLGNVTTGTVNIQVNGGMIWYVDNTYAGENGASDGSYLKPFTQLSSLNGTANNGSASGDADGTGDTIFVYHNGAANVGGITLEANQSLIGDGQALLVNGHNIGGTERTGGVDNVATNSVINHSGVGVTLATDNQVKGLDLAGTADTAIGIGDGGGTVGSLTVSNVGISGQGQIVDIDQGGTLNVTLNSATSTSNSNGAGNGAIDLNGVQGSFTVTGATTINSSVGTQTGGGIDVTAASGTLAVTLQGNVTVNTGTTNAINFSSNTNGASSLTMSGGAKDITTTSGNAVTMTGNSNTTESFTNGGLNIDTTTGTGLNLGGGTLNITGANNTIDTTAGQILVASNATVGASNVNLASLTATAATTGNAIDINNLDGGSFTVGGVAITNTGAGFDALNIRGASSTNFTFNGNTDINGTGSGGDGVELNGANGTVSFANLTVDGVTGTGNGVLINGATAQVTINGAIGTGANTGDALNITGGSGPITIGASIAKNNGGNVVEVNGHTAGAVSFTGAISASGGANNGINLVNNSGGTIDFSHSGITLNTGGSAAITMSNTAVTGATVSFTGGGLNIDTTGGTGISTTSTTAGAGTLNVTGTGNVIDSTIGTALSIVNTNIGASDVTFEHITSGTGAGSTGTGIILDTTGSSGGLHVTGTGTAGSGGTIQHKTGTDGSNTTGIGIYLNNTYDVQLNRMQLNDFDNFAIRGNNVNNFSLADSTINGQSGNVVSGADEAAIRFDGLTGQASITNSTLLGGYEYIVKVLNTTGTLDRLTVSNTTIGNNHDSSSGNGGDAFQVVASNTATVNVSLVNDTFQGAGANVINLVAQNSANLDAYIHNNNVTNSHANQAGTSSNLLVASSSTGNVTYDIQNNTLVADTTSAIHNTSNGIAVAKGIPDTGSGGTMSGVINNNTIGTSGVANSGSAFTGIFASSLGSGTHTTVISNNTIYHFNEEGIYLKANDSLTGGSSVLNATVIGNDTLQPDSLAFAGLWVLAGSGSGTENNVVNITLGDAANAAAKNDFSAGDPSNFSDVEIQELGSGSAVNLSKAGSVSGTVSQVVKDDNLNGGTTVVDSFGTINLVTAVSYRVIASPATVYEDGTTNIVYTFIRHGDTTSAATIPFSVGGTAVFGSDYSQSGAASFTTTTGSVTFAAGSSTAQVTLDPTPDALVEGNETITLTITSGAAVNPASATAKIIDGDTVPLLVSPDAGAHPHDTPGGDGSAPVTDGDAGAGAIGGHPTPSGPTGGPATVDIGSLTGQPGAADDGVVGQAALNLIVDAAILRWSEAGLSPEQLAAMRAVSVTVSDMMGLYVGASSAGQIHIDSDGAGYGWFVDTTPGDDSEFEGSGTRLAGDPGSAAGTHIDLLTVVMHELGHQIGLDDTYAAANFAELMYGYVNPGERRLPGAGDAEGAVPGSLVHEEYAVGPITNVTTLPAGKGVDIIFDSTVDTFTNQIIPVFHNQATVSGINFTSPVTSNVEDLVVDSLTLGDLIFFDANNNGVFDAGDTGVAGVALTLFADTNANGTFDAGTDTQLATTTTGAGGLYSFAGLAPGDYIVRVDASNFAVAGALIGKTTASGGSDPDDDVNNDDNGVDAAGGIVVSQAITLTMNGETTADGTGQFDINNTLDFGFAKPNAAPVFTGLDGTPTFTEDGAAVVLDGDATVSDADLTAGNYAGATLTLARSGGAAAEDVFGTSGTLSFSGANVLVGATTVGTFTQSGGTLAITFNVNATQALVNTTLQDLTYSNTNDTPPASAVIAYAFDDGNTGPQGTGGALTATGSVTVSITATDDPAVAVNDPGNVTDENATVNIAVVANDSDVDGPAPSVAQVDGQAISVGSPVTLTSGAIVSLNLDGTLTYDPNGQFDTLTNTSGGETGAVNTSAPDSFTYTLAGTGGGTATVSVTVNGVANAADHLDGDSGDNIITGTSNGDFFDLSQGGNDTANGLGGNDGYYFGAAYTNADVVNDSGGTNDQIGLKGDYSGGVTLGTIIGIEALVVLPGFSYDITTVDANVAAGGVLNVQATQLAVGQSLTFDGSAETDGAFKIFGGNGDDNLTGGAGNDGFYFGPGGFNSADIVNGGGGINDQLALDGDYTITLGGNVTNVEVLVLLHGPTGTPNTFDVTSGNAFVAAGQTMTVFGLQVETGIIFNGSGELDGAFKIYGGTDADTLTGGSGADWIFGGLGADGLTGGAGNDIFYYDMVAQSTAANGDTIFDFATGDKVDVSGIDAIPGGANDAFTFLGSGAFTNHAGELRAENTGGNTWLVQGDTNGDGAADFQLTLITSDAHPIATGDFTL